jgi:hypothetical protein
MQKPFVFSRNPPVTEAEVWSWAVGIEQGDESAKEPLIKKFILHRLTHRYITPLKRGAERISYYGGVLFVNRGLAIVC